MGQISVGDFKGADFSFDERKRDLDLLKQKEEEEKKKKDDEAKRSPFPKGFYQVNKETNKHLIALARKCPKALEVFLFLCGHMDNYNAVVVSHQVLQEQCGDVSRQTISKAIKYLKDNGYIYVYKSGVSNVYVANKELVWNSWGRNTKYCKFPANVILTSSEQDNDSNLKSEKLKIINFNENVTMIETGVNEENGNAERETSSDSREANGIPGGILPTGENGTTRRDSE